MRAPSTGVMVDATATMLLRATTGRKSSVGNKRKPAVVNMRLVEVDVDVQWSMKGYMMAYLRFELLLLPSEVGGQVMSWSRCLGSHVVIRESGRRRRGIATWTSSKEILAFLRVET